MKISVASGKGGTGKTTVALLMARLKPGILLVDSDVEEPNCHLFLAANQNKEIEKVTVQKPVIDLEKCNACGRCAEVCLFNAIAVAKKALLFTELCHSCGNCSRFCPENAIREQPQEIGYIAKERSLLWGKLNAGEMSSGVLIKALQSKAEKHKDTDYILWDCPPGTSCSMAAAVKDADYCILVTEPTPFGKHDLKAAYEVLVRLNIPCGVVINRSDGEKGDQMIEDFCGQQNIEILIKLPHLLSFAEGYAAGHLRPDFDAKIAELWNKVLQRRPSNEGACGR